MRQLQHFGIGIDKQKMKHLLRKDIYSNNNILGTMKTIFAPTPEVAQQRREAVTNIFTKPAPSTQKMPLQAQYTKTITPMSYRITKTPTEISPTGLITKTIPTGILMGRTELEGGTNYRPENIRGYSTKDPTAYIRKQEPLHPLATPIGLAQIEKQQQNMQANTVTNEANMILKQKYVDYGKQYSNIKVQEQTPYMNRAKPIEIPLINRYLPGELIGRKPLEVSGLADHSTNTITINPKLNTYPTLKTDVTAHEYGHMMEQPISPKALTELQGYFGKKPTDEMSKKAYTTSMWQKELVPKGIEAIDQPKFRSGAPTAYNEIRQNLQRYASTVDPMNPEYNAVGMSIAPKYSTTGTGFRII